MVTAIIGFSVIVLICVALVVGYYFLGKREHEQYLEPDKELKPDEDEKRHDDDLTE